jgi:hypothetical protein
MKIRWFAGIAFGAVLGTCGCSMPARITDLSQSGDIPVDSKGVRPTAGGAQAFISCDDVTPLLAPSSPWILKIDKASQVAELVVHASFESIGSGAPAGNRTGHVLVSERAYEVTIPGESGGAGSDAWFRARLAFAIDRFTGMGTVELGEESPAQNLKPLEFPIRCEVVSHKL